MWAQRPYRDSLTRTEILSELEKGTGAQWDPELVAIVLAGIECGDIGFTPPTWLSASLASFTVAAGLTLIGGLLDRNRQV